MSRETDSGGKSRLPTAEPNGPVRVEDLGELINAKRKADGLTLADVARQTGVSPSTLSRVERRSKEAPIGQNEKPAPIPDTRTLAALAEWLGVALDRFVEVSEPSPMQGVSHREGDTVPDMVEAHLRADRNLDSATAAALARTFRVAYEQFARLSNSPQTASTAGAEERVDS